MRARDKNNGRFVTWPKARAQKLRELDAAIAGLTDALHEATGAVSAKVVNTSIFSAAVVFRSPQTWVKMIDVMEDADVTGVKKYARVRYLIAGKNADGEIKPLSRAYASAELALGEAISTMEGETVLSPKEGDDTGSDTMWDAIVVNVFLRKDAMR